MITLKHPEVEVRKSHLAVALYGTDNLKAMAVQMVGGHVEVHLDMINDAGQSEYSNFSEIEGAIASAKETVLDFFEEMIDDFRKNLLAEIKKVDIDVSDVIFKKDGDIDITATVSIKE